MSSIEEERVLTEIAEKCEELGGQPKVKEGFKFGSPSQSLYCRISDEKLPEMYRYIKEKLNELNTANVDIVLTGNTEKVWIDYYRGDITVKLERELFGDDFPTLFFNKREVGYTRGNTKVEVSCINWGHTVDCKGGIKVSGELPDFDTLNKEVDRVYGRLKASVESDYMAFVNVCRENGGKLSKREYGYREKLVCEVPDTESGNKVYEALVEKGRRGNICNGNADIVYGDGNTEAIVSCEEGDIPKLYVWHGKQVILPRDTVDHPAVAKFIDLFYHGCNADDDEVTCEGEEWLSKIDNPFSTNTISETIAKVDKVIDLIVRSHEDLGKGNVWEYVETERACGIPFPVFEKDGEELALGFGAGADGGYGFEDIEEIPDTLMREMKEYDYAGETYLIDELRDTCEEE